jgi:hypothetical protein
MSTHPVPTDPEAAFAADIETLLTSTSTFIEALSELDEIEEFRATATELLADLSATYLALEAQQYTYLARRVALRQAALVTCLLRPDAAREAIDLLVELDEDDRSV